MWVLGWILQWVLQQTMYDLRQEVEAKLNRLPLPYFDNRRRGGILSRVTNDIDNVGQSLQQTLSQLLDSLLTVVAVARDDVLDLVEPGAHRARQDPDLHRRHGRHREALAEALRAAVAQHR